MTPKQMLKANFPVGWAATRGIYNAGASVLKVILPEVGNRILPDFKEGDVPNLSNPTTQLCSASQFDEAEYGRLCSEIKMPHMRHRKQWEYIYIIASIMKSGLVKPNARGLSFGCGTEPMAAFFAKMGCSIVGTDMPPAMAKDASWTQYDQHASNKHALNVNGICDSDTFERNVDFRFVDMNNIPDDLTGFDFLWSSCALEHLGSLDHGWSFIKNAMKCLKPGGVAVHTTEFTISSLDETYESPEVSFYRKNDIYRLAEDLKSTAKIHAPNFRCMSNDRDELVDRRPFTASEQYKIFLRGHVITSIGIIVQKN
jgi:SAM-dependent methyltransferase